MKKKIKTKMVNRQPAEQQRITELLLFRCLKLSITDIQRKQEETVRKQSFNHPGSKV